MLPNEKLKGIIAFSVLCVFCLNGVYAQTITGKELMALAQCQKAGCLNEIVVAKGFAFLKSNKDTLGSTYYQYLSQDAFAASINPDTYTKNEIEVFFDNTSKNRFSVVFTTKVKKHYQSLLTEMQKMGFEPSKVFNLKNGRQAHYFNEKKHYQLVASEYTVGKKAKDESSMVYRVSLLR